MACTSFHLLAGFLKIVLRTPPKMSEPSLARLNGVRLRFSVAAAGRLEMHALTLADWAARARASGKSGLTPTRCSWLAQHHSFHDSSVHNGRVDARAKTMEDGICRKVGEYIAALCESNFAIVRHRSFNCKVA